MGGRRLVDLRAEPSPPDTYVGVLLGISVSSWLTGPLPGSCLRLECKELVRLVSAGALLKTPVPVS